MAKLIQRPTVQLEVLFQLTEVECRALEALVGYGVDSFLKVFYQHMGEAYLRPHEQGLRSLFESVRTELPGPLDRAKKAREVFNPPLVDNLRV